MEHKEGAINSAWSHQGKLHRKEENIIMVNRVQKLKLLEEQGESSSTTGTSKEF